KHSNALGEAIVNDLFNYCPTLKSKALSGEIVYDLNFEIFGGNDKWNVDLVIGSAPLGTHSAQSNYIMRMSPASVQIAIELKSVMTEHHKAVKNRKRDLEAHHAHVHKYNQNTIAGGVFLINGSDIFKSPLRPEITEHKRPVELINHCIDEIRSIESSGGIVGKPGLDAKAVVCVNCDNLLLAGTRYITTRPAPQIGDPLHYDSFIQTLCNLYTARFR
ncbi:MAG TPA: hypothetical protein VGJ92_11350, partial [Methanocella sp.]